MGSPLLQRSTEHLLLTDAQANQGDQDSGRARFTASTSPAHGAFCVLTHPQRAWRQNTGQASASVAGAGAPAAAQGLSSGTCNDRDGSESAPEARFPCEQQGLQEQEWKSQAHLAKFFVDFLPPAGKASPRCLESAAGGVSL